MADGFTLEIDDSIAQLRLAKIAPAVRANLLTVAQAYETQLLAAVKARAPVKSGAYLASIRGSVRSTASGVRASIHAGGGKAWYAHIIERGAIIPPHEILPKIAQALKFMGDVGAVYAKHVHAPGGTIAARNVLGAPFADMKEEIVDALKSAVSSAAASA